METINQTHFRIHELLSNILSSSRIYVSRYIILGILKLGIRTPLRYIGTVGLV